VKLGRVLKRYRLMEEMDLRSLAKQIGCSAATLMRVEMGHTPSGETLAKIIHWLTAQS
jgi:transcriptional regulator with XRE-family HTH domain